MADTPSIPATDAPEDLTFAQRKDGALFALGYLTGAINGQPEAELVAKAHLELRSFIDHAHWLHGEGEISDALRIKLSDLLTRTANVLKGEPGPLSRHSWHDLPESALLAMHPDMGKVRRAAAKFAFWWTATEMEHAAKHQQAFMDRQPILRHQGESIEIDIFAGDIRTLLAAIYGSWQHLTPDPIAP